MSCGTGLAFFVGLVCMPTGPVVYNKDEGPKSQVLVAKTDIPADAVLSAANVRFDYVSNDSLPVGAILEYSKANRRKALYPISKGAPICDMDLYPFMVQVENPVEINGKIDLSAKLEAIAFKIERVKGVQLPGIPSRPAGPVVSLASLAEMLKAEESVDIYVSENAAMPPRLLAAGVRVKSPLGEDSVLTLLVSPKIAETVKMASREGRLQISTQEKNNTAITEKTGPVKHETNNTVNNQVENTSNQFVELKPTTLQPIKGSRANAESIARKTNTTSHVADLIVAP
ncbi:MAG: SAF domain-containing protein, partial [Thermoguttaceae bacterium]